MKYLFLLFCFNLFISCSNGNDKSPNELKYDSIQFVFRENQDYLDEFVELEFERDKEFTKEYYNDLTKLTYDSMLVKYNIRDEDFFLSSISLTSQSIKLKNSLENLSLETDSLILKIYSDTLENDIDTLVPLHLEENLEFKKLE